MVPVISMLERVTNLAGEQINSRHRCLSFGASSRGRKPGGHSATTACYCAGADQPDSRICKSARSTIAIFTGEVPSMRFSTRIDLPHCRDLEKPLAVKKRKLCGL